MNKIRIIDLLNKIANGEEPPAKIKTDINTIWIYDENNQRYYLQDAPYITLSFEATNTLNNGVEIIEDEDINIQDIEEYGEYQGVNTLIDQINKLIKAVKKLDKEINK